jgi:predicted dienelactone hydrolase
MPLRFALALVLLSGCAGARVPAVSVGLATVPTQRGTRDLAPRLWYRAVEGDASTVVRGRPAFVGERVSPDAAFLNEGPRPLVVLSHGYWGGAMSQAWLATRLVERGFLVVSLQHPGTMTDSQTTEARIRLWERARDVSFLLDRLLADPVWGPRINRDRIAFVGHSMGGWTGAALAGGIYDWQRQLNACRGMKRPDFYCRNTLQIDAAASVPLEGNGRSTADPRFRAFVLLAPGPAGGFTRESLAAIRAPLWVIGAEHDDVLDVVANADRLASEIPGARRTRMDVDHYAFVPRCNLLGKMRVGFLCKNGGQERDRLHQTVADGIVAFLNGSWAVEAR